MTGKKNFPAKNGAGTVPPPQDGEYTVDDLKTVLEESERSLHDAVFIARQVWEKDSDAVKFDVDDWVQIESALQEICKYIIEHPGTPRVIYSDSKTAITWYRERRTASARYCPALLKAEIFLKVMDEKIRDIRLEYWDNRLWGENPADFGNK